MADILKDVHLPVDLKLYTCKSFSQKDEGEESYVCYM